MKKVLVVDDSALMRRVISDIINTIEDCQTVGFCKDGLEAYEVIKHTKLDVVLLDINMPKMNGIELLKKLKADKGKVYPAIIMVSTLAVKDSDITLECMENGAIDFVTKPKNIIEAKGQDFKESIIRVLKAVSLTERYRARLASIATATKPVERVSKKEDRFVPMSNNSIIGIACSTGGPKALQTFVPLLKNKLKCPVVIVQHMPEGFTKSMADRIDMKSQLKVKEAADGDILENGQVYIAKGGYHMYIEEKVKGVRRIRLDKAPSVGGLRPCADVMFQSLKDTSYDQVVCIVLTGMGADGTRGIGELKKRKQLYVIGQDEESSVVYGMPKAVKEAGLTDAVASLENIAQIINNSMGGK